MNHPFTVSAGAPWPLGATVTEDGVNFAVFSAHATRMTLCLFEPDGRETRVDLPEREGDVWHGHLAGVKPGQLYGYRAHGPYRPDEGHRFNPYKLLLDPYARRITGQPEWHDVLYGYTYGSASKDLAFDSRNSAASMPRCVVEETAFPLVDEPPPHAADRHGDLRGPREGPDPAPPRHPRQGHLLRPRRSPDPRPPDEARRHRDRAPARPRLPQRPLPRGQGPHELLGLPDAWLLRPRTALPPDGRIADFRHMVDRFHEAGIEVILDVVYNHSGEGDELGPTLIFRGLDNRSYYRLQQNPRYYVNDTGTGNTLNLDHPMVLRMVMDSLRYWVEVMGVDGFRFDLCATLGRTASGFHRDAPFFQAIRQDPVLSRVKLIAEPWDIGPGGYQLGAFPPPFLEWNDRFRDGVRRFWRGDPGRAPDLAERITGSAQQFDHAGRLATVLGQPRDLARRLHAQRRRHLRRTLQPRERRKRAGRPRRELLRQPRRSKARPTTTPSSPPAPAASAT